MRKRIFTILLLGPISIFIFLFSNQVLADSITQVTPPKPQVEIPGLKPFGQPVEQPCPANKFVVNGQDILLGKNCLVIPWIGDYIIAWYRWLVGIVGILAVVLIMWGGLRWTTAGGNQEHVSSAKEIIFSALIGLFLLIGSYVFLNTINPSLVQIQGIIVPGVTRISLGRGPCSKIEGAENQYCGKRINPAKSWPPCYSPFPGDPGYKIGSAEYKACCTEGGKFTDCCVGDSCKNSDGSDGGTCVQVGEEFRCFQTKLYGSINCTSSGGHFIEDQLQLWALCRTFRVAGSYTAIPAKKIHCDDSKDSYSFCTTCTGGQHTYVFSPGDIADVIATNGGGCNEAPIGYFIAAEVDDDSALSSGWNDWYLVGKNGQPVNKKPLDLATQDQYPNGFQSWFDVVYPDWEENIITFTKEGAPVEVNFDILDRVRNRWQGD